MHTNVAFVAENHLVAVLPQVSGTRHKHVRRIRCPDPPGSRWPAACSADTCSPAPPAPAPWWARPALGVLRHTNETAAYLRVSDTMVGPYDFRDVESMEGIRKSSHKNCIRNWLLCEWMAQMHGFVYCIYWSVRAWRSWCFQRLPSQ